MQHETEGLDPEVAGDKPSESLPLVDLKRLPEANEFSPGQVELRRVLELARRHSGSRDRLVEAIRAEYFEDSAMARKNLDERLKQQRTRANNVLIGMKGYGLFDLESNTLTDFGMRLLDITDDVDRRETFASHILRNRHGIEVLEAVRAIQARNERPGKAPLASELETRGFKLPRATTHHTKVLQWLREAGVVAKSYEIDEETFGRLAGVDSATLAEWSSLTHEQAALLLTLRQLAEVHESEFLPARDVITQAKLEHGAIFREDQLRARVFRPLEDQGWIESDVGTRGRGGKSGRVRATEKLLSVDVASFPGEGKWGIPADLRAKLNTPVETIYENLKSDETYVKGLALELLALRLATDLALRPIVFRLRAKDTTGGGEVDLVAEGVHLHFTRWLFQCKNTATVRLTDVAKEVGMAALLRPNVIVVVTTGRFAGGVDEFAREIEQAHSLQVVLVDHDALARYRSGGISALTSFFRARAEATMKQKRIQVRSAAVVD
jgi:hypothetical protein